MAVGVAGDDLTRAHVLRLITRKTTHYVKTDSAKDLSGWVTAIRGAMALSKADDCKIITDILIAIITSKVIRPVSSSFRNAQRPIAISHITKKLQEDPGTAS